MTIIYIEDVEANVSILRLLFNTDLLLAPYILAIIVVAVIWYKRQDSVFDIINSYKFYWTLVSIISIVGLVLLLIGSLPAIDPQNDHDEAIEAGADAVLDGEYPYYASSNTEFIVANFTTLPFTYLVAIPFYLLLDVSALAIIGYLLFSISVYKLSDSPIQATVSMGVFSIAIPGYYMFIIQSDHLFIVGVFSLLALAIQQRNKFQSGLWGGALIATKGFVWPALVLSGYCSVRTWKTKNWLKFGITTGFISGVLILPFYLSDPTHFTTVAPLGVQARHFPALFGSYSAIVFTSISLLLGIIHFELTDNIWMGMYTSSLFLFLFLPLKFMMISVVLGSIIIATEVEIRDDDPPLAT